MSYVKCQKRLDDLMHGFKVVSKIKIVCSIFISELVPDDKVLVIDYDN